MGLLQLIFLAPNCELSLVLCIKLASKYKIKNKLKAILTITSGLKRQLISLIRSLESIPFDAFLNI